MSGKGASALTALRTFRSLFSPPVPETRWPTGSMPSFRTPEEIMSHIHLPRPFSLPRRRPLFLHHQEPEIRPGLRFGAVLFLPAGEGDRRFRTVQRRGSRDTRTPSLDQVLEQRIQPGFCHRFRDSLSSRGSCGQENHKALPPYHHPDQARGGRKGPERQGRFPPCPFRALQ